MHIVKLYLQSFLNGYANLFYKRRLLEFRITEFKRRYLGLTNCLSSADGLAIFVLRGIDEFTSNVNPATLKISKSLVT